MADQSNPLNDLDARAQDIFRRLVEEYLETGDPVGSRTLSRNLVQRMSAATIRNVMQDLDHLGLIESPHVSAGRIPTQQGLRLFVDGVLEVNGLAKRERESIKKSMRADELDLEKTLDNVGSALSGLTQTASIVLAPKSEAPVKHIEFVSLSQDRALVVLVFADGHVENRLFTPPVGITPSAMREAANFLNAICVGEPLSAMKSKIETEVKRRRQEIDELAEGLIEAGIAQWMGEDQSSSNLIVRGRSNLLDEAREEDLERIKTLFDDLERKRDLAQFLTLAEDAEGVKIFIGSENKLFSLSGSSLVISPYMNVDQKVIGAVGVIGPTRLNYGRIVPIVDYTAQLVGRFIAERN